MLPQLLTGLGVGDPAAEVAEVGIGDRRGQRGGQAGGGRHRRRVGHRHHRRVGAGRLSRRWDLGIAFTPGRQQRRRSNDHGDQPDNCRR